MQWNAIISYTVPLICAAAVSAALALIAWRRRSVPGALALMSLCLAIGVWSSAYALELGSPDVPTRVFWNKVQYLGIVVTPVAWLSFGLQYTGRHHWTRWRTMALLALIPLLTLVLVWTNEQHRLIWSSTALNSDGPFPILDSSYGAWFWVHTAYSYLCLLTGTLVLIHAFVRSPGLYRRQIMLMLGAAAAPWVGNALFIFELSPWPGLDLTPFAFTLSCIAIAWALFRLHFLDIVPIARDNVIESMSDGVIVLDEQSRIVDINPAACSVLGHKPADIIGQPVASALERAPHMVERYRNVTDLAEEVSVEQDGTCRTYDLRISPIRDRRGRMRGRLIVWRDISDIKQVQAKLLRQNEELTNLQEGLIRAVDAAEAASRAKSTFLANMSHELRTPLTAILGYSQLLHREAQEMHADNLRRDIEAIWSAGDHLLTLISNILDLSKIEAGKMELFLEVFDITALVNTVAATVRPLMADNGNTLVVQYSPDLGTMRADLTKTRQILFNLLSNAAKFTDRGTITLTVARKMQEGREGIIFRVSDTGIGIPADKLEIIFKEFTQADASTTRKYGGTGLGLTLSYRFCRMMGGDIHVVSSVGKGSTFTIFLPSEVVQATTSPALPVETPA